MANRPSRLFIIKFLGLWGGSNAPLNVDEKEKKHKGRALETKFFESTKVAKEDSSSQNDYRLPIELSNKKILSLILEKGVPGLTIAVSKRGETVWKAAFGYCDVENQLGCEPDARMRIASISKSLFAATVVAPLIEDKKLDIKSSVHQYLTPDEFPKQKFEGKEYDITIEQLLSHTSGVKHYERFKPEDSVLKPIGSSESKKIYQNDEQLKRKGYFQRQTYRNVIDALEPFKDGPLASEPGTFKYTTYGYTLLSAVVQKVLQLDDKTKSTQVEDFWMKVLANDWKLEESCLDQDEVIIPKRARYYLRSSFNGGLVNAPYQDSSVKWAGGGIISTTNDLLKFGNTLIACYKGRENSKLKKETIELLWKEIKNSYALGFKVKSINSKLVISHDGAALGASSVLIIYPESEIVVAILTNLGSVDLNPLALFIADEFEKLN